MSNKISLFTLILVLLAPIYACAQEIHSPIQIKDPIRFGLPIDCTLNEDCWIVNYVDYGDGDNLQTDPACLARTYDTHKGTDFAILDEAALNNGVDVIAPMDGTILRVRDGEEDSWKSDQELTDIQEQRKECGNAIMIDHGDGLQTVYCHLKKNSISVRRNQSVKKGDAIGKVGLSGFTEFPHLHFGIINNGDILDPFTAKSNNERCGLNKKSLWNKELNIAYEPFIIQASGFSDTVPELDRIEKNAFSKNEISSQTEKLTFWALLLGVREGDKISLKIHDASGRVFAEQEIIQDKTRARQFYFIGKNLVRKSPLKEGAYTGTVSLSRGEERDFKVITTLITP
ncbi:MAG: M23 family metallopeptidase [Pseudomonadota bacterium]